MAIVKAQNARKDIPLVSIIAVCYNHSRYVEETLDSILNQTYENIELIIIDSNSPDNSVEVIQNWVNKNNVECTFIKQTEPRNISQNLNEGVRISKGEYFQGLSCDDLILQQKIKEQVSMFEKSEEVGVVFSRAIKINENSEDLGSFHYCPEEYLKNSMLNEPEKIFSRTALICAPSVLIRRRVFIDVGNFDESIGFEDWDYWLRIAKDKWTFYYFNYSTVKYRHIHNSMSRSLSMNYVLSLLKLFHKHRILKNKVVLEKYFKIFRRELSINDLLNVLNQLIKMDYFLFFYMALHLCKLPRRIRILFVQ